jgi:hypothetical protein
MAGKSLESLSLTTHGTFKTNSSSIHLTNFKRGLLKIIEVPHQFSRSEAIGKILLLFLKDKNLIEVGVQMWAA